MRVCLAGSPRVNQASRWLVAEAEEHLGDLAASATRFPRIADWTGVRPAEMTMRGLTESFARHRAILLYARLGRLEDARRHGEIFRTTVNNPDPEYTHLIDEAREALEDAERQAG